MQHMISFENVTKVHKNTDKPSITKFSLDIGEGEFLALIGPSGAGKTTIFRMLIGEIKPTEGYVWYKGDNVHRLGDRKTREHRRKFGVIFQDFKLLDSRTTYENVSFAMEVSGKSDYEIKKMVPHILGIVNLADKANHFPHELSGGEKQRLAIARAIVNEPDVVLADEPTGNLDPRAAFDILEILKKIHELGTTVILSTHNMELIEAINERIVVVDNGEIVEDSSGSDSKDNHSSN